MARWSSLAALFLAGAVAAALAAWHSGDDGEAAGPLRRVMIPAVAMDSSPPVTTNRTVIVGVELDILEPALTGSGQTLVQIRAYAHGPLPGQLEPPVTVSGTITITTHPADVCAWNPIVGNATFSMTYYQPPGSDLKLHINFSGLEWYYMVQCPGGVPPIRFPAGSVNESLTGWLGLLFPGVGGPGGATVDTPVFSGAPDCVRRKGLESNTNMWGAGVVRIWVTQPPCLVATE